MTHDDGERTKQNKKKNICTVVLIDRAPLACVYENITERRLPPVKSRQIIKKRKEREREREKNI